MYQIKFRMYILKQQSYNDKTIKHSKKKKRSKTQNITKVILKETYKMILLIYCI